MSLVSFPFRKPNAQFVRRLFAPAADSCRVPHSSGCRFCVRDGGGRAVRHRARPLSASVCVAHYDLTAGQINPIRLRRLAPGERGQHPNNRHRIDWTTPAARPRLSAPAPSGPPGLFLCAVSGTARRPAAPAVRARYDHKLDHSGAPSPSNVRARMWRIHNRSEVVSGTLMALP